MSGLKQNSKRLVGSQSSTLVFTSVQRIWKLIDPGKIKNTTPKPLQMATIFVQIAHIHPYYFRVQNFMVHKMTKCHSNVVGPSTGCH